MEHASKEIEKEKIRNRYKGVSPDLLEVIPAEEHVDILQDDREKRVGVYVRVSTDDPRQTSSFELQRNHYTDLIDRYPNWHLYRIYADEGISGTSLKHRKSFIKMIEDCKQHKLDLIVTKSVSRFARNIYDCIGYIRMLAALKPPVGVFFETEGLYTLRDDSEMALTFTASFAQEESRTRRLMTVRRCRSRIWRYLKTWPTSWPGTPIPLSPALLRSGWMNLRCSPFTRCCRRSWICGVPIS